MIETSERITEDVGEFLGQVHHFSDGLYAKQVHIPANYIVGGHKHAYSHLSILAQGTVIVQAGTKQTEYTAPACIDIKAGIEHKVFAKTDAVWYCVHATEETDVGKIDEVLVGKGE
jgi:quercetin dioxygenase-like cupin family protein